MVLLLKQQLLKSREANLIKEQQLENAYNNNKTALEEQIDFLKIRLEIMEESDDNYK